ncbi:MAG: hypothetical protein OIN87_03055 [Candidatus Methanoperedens sp.]|nr:hypothetical protein [Candidatus Methanoperedens sp.]
MLRIVVFRKSMEIISLNRTRMTRMTRIARIFTDTYASVQSVFHRIPSAFICVYLQLIFVSLSERAGGIHIKLFSKINEFKRGIRIPRINPYPFASASSAQSVFYCIPPVFCVHPRSISISFNNRNRKNKPQMNADERRFVNLNTDELFFAVRNLKNTNKLTDTILKEDTFFPIQYNRSTPNT